MQKKKEYLQELEMQRLLYTNLIDRNTHLNPGPEEEKIFLPFIVIHTKKDTSIECEMSEDRKEYFFDFSLPFSIYDDNEILKRLGLAQPFWKQPENIMPNDNSKQQHLQNYSQPPLPSQPLYQQRNPNPSSDYAIPHQLPQRGYLTPSPQLQQSHYNVNLDFMNQ